MPDGSGIRFGLGAVKNLGVSAVDAVLKAREENGCFRSLVEFCEHVDVSAVNRRMIESLIKAGAMDSLGGTRSQLMAALDGALESGQRALRDRNSGQGGLFAAFSVEQQPEKPLPSVPDWTAKEKLANEKEVLGFYVTGHPLDDYRDKVSELTTFTSSTLEGLERGSEIALCGVITNVQRKRNREGKAWASFQLDDWTGAAECILFPSTYEELGGELQEDKAVLVRGTALPEENAPAKISVKELVALDKARLHLPRLVSIRVLLGSNGSDRAQALTQLFGRKPGEAEVRLRLEKPRDFSIILDVAARVRPDREFCAEVERICGPQSMEVLAD
jgi:DNA polymerase-3 subunit alpha